VGAVSVPTSHMDAAAPLYHQPILRKRDQTVSNQTGTSSARVSEREAAERTRFGGGGAHLGGGDLVEAVEHEADAGEEVRVGVFFGAVRGHGEGHGRSGDWELGFCLSSPDD
jgi:hypothetical protein